MLWGTQTETRSLERCVDSRRQSPCKRPTQQNPSYKAPIWIDTIPLIWSNHSNAYKHDSHDITLCHSIWTPCWYVDVILSWLQSYISICLKHNSTYQYIQWSQIHKESSYQMTTLKNPEMYLPYSINFCLYVSYLHAWICSQFALNKTSNFYVFCHVRWSIYMWNYCDDDWVSLSNIEFE